MGTPEPWTVLRGHAGEVQAVSFLGARRLFSGDSDGCVKLWDLDARRSVCEARLQDAQAGVLSLQCHETPSGDYLLFSCGRDGSVKAHHVNPDGLLLQQCCMQFNTGAYGFCRPDAIPAAHLPSRSNPGTDQTASRQTAASPNNTNACAQLGLGSWLIACSGSESGQTVVWDVRQSAIVHPAVTLQAPDISNFATGEAEPKHPKRHSKPVDAAAETEFKTAIPQTVGAALSVCFMDPNRPCDNQKGNDAAYRLLVGYESGSIAVWDMRSHKQPSDMVTRAHKDPVLCIARSPDSTQFVSGAADSSVLFWQCGPEQNTLSCTVSYDVLEPGTSHASWRPDGRVVATSGWDGKVRVYSGKSKHKPLAILRYHKREVACLAWSPGSHYDTLATHSNDNDDQLEAEDTKVHSDMECEHQSGQQPGLGLLASGSRDGTIALWRLYEWSV